MLAARSAAGQRAPEPACNSRTAGLQLEAALPVLGASQAVAAGACHLNEGGALFLWTALGARSIALPHPADKSVPERLPLSATPLQSVLLASPGTRAQESPDHVTALLSPPWLLIHDWGSPEFILGQCNSPGEDQGRNGLDGLDAAYSQEAATKWPGYGLALGGVCSPRLMPEQVDWHWVVTWGATAPDVCRPCGRRAMSATLRTLCRSVCTNVTWRALPLKKCRSGARRHAKACGPRSCRSRAMPRLSSRCSCR